jgi:hypothetical protein
LNFKTVVLNKNVHDLDPRTTTSGISVVVGGLKVSLMLVQNQGLGFGFGLEPS